MGVRSRKNRDPIIGGFGIGTLLSGHFLLKLCIKKDKGNSGLLLVTHAILKV
jgi:hypothetical protein